MSASSHFMIPVSVTVPSLAGAGRRQKRTEPKPQVVAEADWQELDAARRRASLLALLAIYAVGLGLVVMLYDGEDIGVILSAFLAHAIYVGARGISAALRSQRIETRRGTLLIHARARLLPALAAR